MIKEEIKNLIERSIEKTKEQKKLPPDFKVPEILIEHPKNPEFGFWTTSSETVFTGLEKEEKKIATEAMIKNLYSLKESKDLIKNIKAVGPFINLYPNPEFLQSKVKEILKQDKNFGSQNIGRNKTIIIDYSSPNIAKPMHVGHLRSTIIGQAIYNIYKFLGYKPISDNHLGDWGTQFGIMIAAIKRYKTDLKSINIGEMLDIYVKFNKEIEKNPDLHENAKEEFNKLEQGDKENRKIWKILRDKSLKEFDKIYKILGIKFDLVLGESFYEKHLKEEVSSALKRKAAIKNPDNSVIIPLDKFNPVPFLIQKSDGATLYGTRDLATLRYRVKKYKPAEIIYVIGNEQSFYLEQLFRVAEILDYMPYDKLYHIKFGLVLDENRKKLATRAGRVIGAKDLINKAIELAEDIIKEKNPKLSEKDRKSAAEVIGVGALKYNDLSQNRQTDIVFDWQKMLNFEGNSGPYLQYSYVRLRSILRKAKLGKFDPKFLREEKELEILKELIKFPEVAQEAGEKFQINLLANYLYNLAGLINAFYEKFPVLKAEKDVKEARLALIKSATIVLRNGLNLLGIDILEKM